MPSNYAYYPARELVNATVDQGFALVVVIRSGYYIASGSDEQIVPCNRPQFTEFVTAANAAAGDIVSAKNYLSSLGIFDESLIVLTGTSAGGFASINALTQLDNQVSAAISINGGRCGSRGDAIGGLRWQPC
jgi:dienelactone hydrolase